MPSTKARRDWMKAHTVAYSVRLTTNTDKDLIQYLDIQPSKQGAIKAALREKMARENPKE